MRADPEDVDQDKRCGRDQRNAIDRRSSANKGCATSFSPHGPLNAETLASCPFVDEMRTG